MPYKYTFEKEKCWYNRECKLYQSDNCSSACIRYMEMHYLMSSSGIPPARQYFNPLCPPQEDTAAFLRLKRIKEDIADYIGKGNNLYIYSSNSGNGKTTWALKLVQQYFNEIWAGNGFAVRGLFVHVPSFLVKIKEVISYKDDDFEEFRNNLLTADVVIWDDIAATKIK